MFTRAEATASALVTFASAAIVSAYLADAVGLSLHPIPILMIATAAAAVAARLTDPASARDERGEPPADVSTFAAIVGATAVWLLWLAWPHLLPIGGGSDLTHHLLLVDYIDRTGRLVHDRALRPFLGEMLDYTPGAHLLAVLGGRWTRTDGLHAIYTVVALSVAIKIGIVFLIARRSVDRSLTALAAPLALFLPRDYLIGSFAHDSFLAQVIAEMFAVAAWWAVVRWDACRDQDRSARAAALFAVAGAGTFLTWPIWIGPLIVTFAAAAWLNRARPGLRSDMALALGPIALLATVHTVGRIGTATIMAGASGFALIPTLASTGWLFPVAGAIGTAASASGRRTRTVPLLLAAIALQALALIIVARLRGAEAPYLALKMAYLAIYPLAVAMAVAIARIPSPIAAAALTTLLLAPAASAIATTPRPAPVVSDELRQAGRWAREHVPPACVDYLVADDDSAYWLHLVVLGNPRDTARSLASETFEPEKALVRWVLPGGLPYAIAADVDALPRDIRTNVDILERAGRAAVIKRRGPSSCN